MAITKDVARQSSLWARKEVSFGDLSDAAATPTEAMDVPAGAIVVGGYVNVKTIFDNSTSDVLDVGDGDDDDRYTSSQIDLQVTAVTTLDVTGYQYTNADTIDLEWTGSGTSSASQGTFELVVEYIVDGRATETETG